MKKFKLLLIVLIIPVLFSGCLINHTLNAAKKSAYGVVDKTLDADNVIYNYEWFKTQYNSYVETVQNYNNAKNDADSYKKDAGERSTWSYSTGQEYNRLNSIASAYRNQVQAIIKEYNAKSQMVNRSIFKTGDLPEQLQIEF